MENYLINEAIKTVVLFVTAYALGMWVQKRNVKVNYTRKIFHFTLFFLPIYLAANIPFQPSLYTTALSGIIFLACISTLSEPFRSRSQFLATAFAAVDRPEDRPYTLLWVSTQVLATYAVLLVALIVLSKYEKTVLIYITVLIAGIGDGLAEPVGVRFGKRKYQVKALFTDRKYTRSIEGSLCVLLSGILAVVILQNHLVGSQFLLALFVIPITMTLAEAWSPHTWDGPFLYLSGGASTVLILELSQVLDNA
jgi:dolichol kinase